MPRQTGRHLETISSADGRDPRRQALKTDAPGSRPGAGPRWAARAMASRCSTALVEPPSAITTVIAFSKAARVMMSRGLMSALSSSRIVLLATITDLSSIL